MVKRKAEGSHGRGKAPARPARQPPPLQAQEDDSDSDVCEIISPPPSSSNPAGRRQQLGQQPSAASFPAAPGVSHPFLPPQGHASVGLMSMMSGLPGGFQLPRPEQGAGFGLGLYQQQTFAQRMQASGGLNPLMYAPPQHLQPPAAGFHTGYFAESPMPLAAGASSGGTSSEAVGELSSIYFHFYMEALLLKRCTAVSYPRTYHAFNRFMFYLVPFFVQRVMSDVLPQSGKQGLAGVHTHFLQSWVERANYIAQCVMFNPSEPYLGVGGSELELSRVVYITGIPAALRSRAGYISIVALPTQT